MGIPFNKRPLNGITESRQIWIQGTHDTIRHAQTTIWKLKKKSWRRRRREEVTAAAPPPAHKTPTTKKSTENIYNHLYSSFLFISFSRYSFTNCENVRHRCRISFIAFQAFVSNENVRQRKHHTYTQCKCKRKC